MVSPKEHVISVLFTIKCLLSSNKAVLLLRTKIITMGLLRSLISKKHASQKMVFLVALTVGSV